MTDDLDKRARDLSRRYDKAMDRGDFDMADRYAKDLDIVLDLMLEQRRTENAT